MFFTRILVGEALTAVWAAVSVGGFIGLEWMRKADLFFKKGIKKPGFVGAGLK